MATFYYELGAFQPGDPDYGNLSALAAWRMDDFTATKVPATSLPTSADDVVLLIDNYAVTVGNGMTVANAEIRSPGHYFYLSLTVTGVAKFYDGAGIEGGTITGNAEFYEGSYCEATITGNATFYDHSRCGAAAGNNMIYGTATFNDHSYFDGGDGSYVANVFNDDSHSDSGSNYYGFYFAPVIYNDRAYNAASAGNWAYAPVFNGESSNQGLVGSEENPQSAIFNDDSLNNGTVYGDAIFNDSSTNWEYGAVSGNATFNDSSHNNQLMGSWGNATFNDNSSNNYGYGNATFNDNSTNYNLWGNATFTNSSYDFSSIGWVSGTTTFSSPTPVTITASGDIDLDASSWVFSTPGNSWIFQGGFINGTFVGNATFNYAANYATITGDATFNSTETGASNFGRIIGNATFNGGTVNYSNDPNTGIVTGDATFNDNSSNGFGGNATVGGNATFNGGSYNTGTVNGDATFKDSSYNAAGGVVNGAETYSNRTPYPIPRGINGSSILGLV